MREFVVHVQCLLLPTGTHHSYTTHVLLREGEGWVDGGRELISYCVGEGGRGNKRPG